MCYDKKLLSIIAFIAIIWLYSSIAALKWKKLIGPMSLV